MRSDALSHAVRTVLMEDWDPIDIKDEPAAQDEYDGFIQHILGLLNRDASVSALSERLLQIETMEMGLRGDYERALRVAEKLAALRNRS